MAVARTLSPRTPPHLVKLLFEVMIMELRSYLSETSWEDHVGFGPVRYTSSELPARLARAQLSMRPCAPCVPPQHHDHDQMHTMHREASSARAARRQAQPSQREGQGFESP
jgi:hypothetical protein